VLRKRVPDTRVKPRASWAILGGDHPLRKEKVVLILRANVRNTPFVAQNAHRLAQSWHSQFTRHHGEHFARAGGQCGVRANPSRSQEDLSFERLRTRTDFGSRGAGAP
jgi:hypothetical protein